MFADHPDFAETSRRAAEIIDGVDDQDRLPQLLVGLVETYAEKSIGFVGGFGRNKRLMVNAIEADASGVVEEETATYAGGGYLLDPYYACYRAGRSGCLPLRDVKPEGFEETEYFRYFYARHGFCDELIHLTAIPGRGAVIIGVVRDESGGPFSDEEIARHQAVHPFVAACASRCSALLDHSLDQTEFHLASLDEALDGFGAGMLTPRESEVIGLVLYGHNTQSVGVQLGITADTVKLHRKHAYAKLRVSSQGELFFMFLGHLGLDTSE
jgi:DNA-binding CsgD family transcriptional regulator